MYNCFFGLPFCRNISYRNTYNGNQQPQANQNQNCSEKMHIQEYSAKTDTSCEANRSLLKCSSLGGIVIPASSSSGTTYNITSINLDTSTFRNFSIYFNFSCNITSNISVGGIHLHFQLFRHEKFTESLIPVSSNFSYSRGTAAPFLITDSFSFTAFDHDATLCKRCNYSLILKILVFNIFDSLIISNPTLAASIIENCNERRNL